MLFLPQAKERILAALKPTGSEQVPLSHAHGRISAESMVAPQDLPRFDNSALNGYAVIANEVLTAQKDEPIALKLVGTVAAGDIPPAQLEPGTCVRVFTGSRLPADADAVVREEQCRIDPNQPDKIWVLEGVGPWENVRIRGEDVKSGTDVLKVGERLTPAVLALLAALGKSKVGVGRRPTVGLLSTGSELCESGAELQPGQIYESNRVALAAFIEALGIEPVIYPLVRDEEPQIQNMLKQAFAECEVVITTGGVSVGKFDLVKDAFQKMGGEVDFWRVGMRPGRPFVFGRWNERFLFGLPGNPVSAVITYLLLVRPALLALQGATAIDLPSQVAWLGESLSNRGNRPHFMRVRMDSEAKAWPVGIQASHSINSLRQADGLVEVPPATTLTEGTKVRVLRWE